MLLLKKMTLAVCTLSSAECQPTPHTEQLSFFLQGRAVTTPHAAVSTAVVMYSFGVAFSFFLLCLGAFFRAQFDPTYFW